MSRLVRKEIEKFIFIGEIRGLNGNESTANIYLLLGS